MIISDIFTNFSEILLWWMHTNYWWVPSFWQPLIFWYKILRHSESCTVDWLSHFHHCNRLFNTRVKWDVGGKILTNRSKVIGNNVYWWYLHVWLEATFLRIKPLRCKKSTSNWNPRSQFFEKSSTNTYSTDFKQKLFYSPFNLNCNHIIPREKHPLKKSGKFRKNLENLLNVSKTDGCFMSLERSYWLRNENVISFEVN